MNNWKVDIGLDQLADDSFSIIIFDSITGDSIATVFGNSAEQAEERANKIVMCNKLYENDFEL